VLPARTALLMSVAIGVALELGRLGGRTGVPVAILLSLAIGGFSSGRGWLAPAAIGPAQFAAALYRGASLATHWVGPFFYFLALSAPMLLAAFLGRRLRLRRTR
jgi:hypothetical protein